MVKRTLAAIAVLLAFLFGGGALVGFDVIPAAAGVVVWILGIALAIVLFLRLAPED